VHKVLIVGDSLFADAMAQLLGRREAVEVAGVTADVAGALAQLPTCQPDLLIVLSDALDLCPLLTAFPDLPILQADLHADSLRMIRSQPVGARTADLLAAIQALPTRR
jgi:DNA-binding NarL/FixJ family response regulator